MPFFGPPLCLGDRLGLCGLGLPSPLPRQMPALAPKPVAAVDGPLHPLSLSLALGKKFAHGKVGGDVKYWRAAADGSAVLTFADGTSAAIDFSKASGAEGMIVMTGPGAQGASVSAGAVSYSFKFLTPGPEPAPKAEGDKVAVGQQTVILKDGNLVLEKWAEP